MKEKIHEGLFWQADHIVPVAEGGGECNLTNLRTLCTMCHMTETKRLRGRLKCAKMADKSSSITASAFRRSTASPPVEVVICDTQPDLVPERTTTNESLGELIICDSQ